MGFAIRIGLHNSYDVILYVWRTFLKRRLPIVRNLFGIKILETNVWPS